MKMRSLGWVIAIGAMVGCQPEPTKPEQSAALVQPGDGVTIVAGQQPDNIQKALMLSAKEALFSALSNKLMQAMSEGPANAIEVCQREASEIATEVGNFHQVKIGRTGVRLRNSSNQAPHWAKDWIESRTEEPQFAVLSNQSAAALLPIKLQPQCVMCHGPADQILPEIKKQLVDRYPNDQAVGFQPGELRGWFWVELPTSAASK
ncbi:MAG: DUF3365 domain-containing protein [Planctomycetaceae bacterium]|nr:DUF3365 domain-containing protein [Planctomycetaceae bacterium]